MKQLARFKGRPLLADGQEVVFAAKDQVLSWRDGVTSLIGRVEGVGLLGRKAPRLIDRLLRNEACHFRRLYDGSDLLVYRRAFHLRPPGETLFRQVYSLPRGSRPLGISTENNGWILFGEYGTLPPTEPVRIMAARPPCFEFQSVHQFSPGSVKHVHNVIWDHHDYCYWVLVGDSDEESGILRLSSDFKPEGWLTRGGQMSRAVAVLPDEGRLLYGTDSERATNFIVSLDKSSGRLSKLAPLEGSCLHLARFGQNILLSTAVEPSKINLDKTCHLYRSRNGTEWERLDSSAKDVWNPTYFQFGTFVLPFVSKDTGSLIVYGGQAIRGHDGTMIIGQLS